MTEICLCHGNSCHFVVTDMRMETPGQELFRIYVSGVLMSVEVAALPLARHLTEEWLGSTARTG